VTEKIRTAIRRRALGIEAVLAALGFADVAVDHVCELDVVLSIK
jgi:hypothetical protein